MSGIITAVLLVVVISLIVGVVLAAASVLMEVKPKRLKKAFPAQTVVHADTQAVRDMQRHFQTERLN